MIEEKFSTRKSRETFANYRSPRTDQKMRTSEEVFEKRKFMVCSSVPSKFLFWICEIIRFRKKPFPSNFFLLKKSKNCDRVFPIFLSKISFLTFSAV